MVNLSGRITENKSVHENTSMSTSSIDSQSSGACPALRSVPLKGIYFLIIGGVHDGVIPFSERDFTMAHFDCSFRFNFNKCSPSFTLRCMRLWAARCKHERSQYRCLLLLGSN